GLHGVVEVLEEHGEGADDQQAEHRRKEGVEANVRLCRTRGDGRLLGDRHRTGASQLLRVVVYELLRGRIRDDRGADGVRVFDRDAQELGVRNGGDADLVAQLVVANRQVQAADDALEDHLAPDQLRVGVGQAFGGEDVVVLDGAGGL